MRVASVTYSRDGYAVELTDIPLRWLVAERAGEAFLAATGHLLCCNLPEWSFRVRWGPLDEESWTPRSLGSVMWRTGQRLSCLSFRHESGRVQIPVTAEWVGEHYPQILEECEFGEDSDAMTATFSEQPG